MANLIPRKQIEESDFLSGSVLINDLVIADNLFVSGNLSAGTDQTNEHRFTGSVFISGSIDITGEILSDGESILSITSRDTLRYNGILSEDFGKVETVFYVTQDGNDTNDGNTLQYPLKSIKKACERSQEYIDVTGFFYKPDMFPIIYTPPIPIGFGSGSFISASQTITENSEYIVDQLWLLFRDTIVTGTSGSYADNPTFEILVKRDAGLLLEAIANDLQYEYPHSTIQFINAFTDNDGVFFINAALIGDFVDSFNIMYSIIENDLGLDPDELQRISELFNLINTTIIRLQSVYGIENDVVVSIPTRDDILDNLSDIIQQWEYKEKFGDIASIIQSNKQSLVDDAWERFKYVTISGTSGSYADNVEYMDFTKRDYGLLVDSLVDGLQLGNPRKVIQFISAFFNRNGQFIIPAVIVPDFIYSWNYLEQAIAVTFSNEITETELARIRLLTRLIRNTFNAVYNQYSIENNEIIAIPTRQQLISNLPNLIQIPTGLPPRVNIQIKTGYYYEEAPVIVPPNTSLLGDDLRTTVVSPTEATKGENLFLMNNSTYAWGLRLQGCELDDLVNPTKGFFFSLAPGAYIVTSPYVQNSSAVHTPQDKLFAPLDVEQGNPLIGNGPGGMLVDDSILHPYSPLRSMIVDAYTQVGFNGIGICVKGRGYAQLVSFFTNFSRIGVYCIDGGHASLLNSNTTFGDYGLYARGTRKVVTPNVSNVPVVVDATAADLIKAQKQLILDYMWDTFIATPPPSGTDYLTTPNFESATKTDAGLLVDSIIQDLGTRGAARTAQFTSGLFKSNAVPVFPDPQNLTQDFILTYNLIYDYISTQTIPDPEFVDARLKIRALLDVVANTLTSVILVGSSEFLEDFGSLITSTSHDFSYAGSGVNFLGLPPNQGGVGRTNEEIRIFEEGGGRVFHSSGDEAGDFFVGRDFKINQATGTIQGRTFSKSLFGLITPFTLALET
jgi:hypothetical protein